ncbi:hypothetical protein SKAU_G00254640 [Synaphobranchus kaupii]|uniref:Uncharacterized protein n=1 Tax=Synaphobranchus kaupii TaxID=118154 RepID=A0A9Q1F3M2_SYNKA|nr:hypothetical protein SKAU_G00254640 [Synaphobranchus kaupii]
MSSPKLSDPHIGCFTTLESERETDLLLRQVSCVLRRGCLRFSRSRACTGWLQVASLRWEMQSESAGVTLFPRAASQSQLFPRSHPSPAYRSNLTSHKWAVEAPAVQFLLQTSHKTPYSPRGLAGAWALQAGVNAVLRAITLL